MVDIRSVNINLDAQQVVVLSDLASRQCTDIEDVVQHLLAEALEHYQEAEHFRQLIDERDSSDAKFVPYDSKIWL